MKRISILLLLIFFKPFAIANNINIPQPFLQRITNIIQNNTIDSLLPLDPNVQSAMNELQIAQAETKRVQDQISTVNSTINAKKTIIDIVCPDAPNTSVCLNAKSAYKEALFEKERLNNHLLAAQKQEQLAQQKIQTAQTQARAQALTQLQNQNTPQLQNGGEPSSSNSGDGGGGGGSENPAEKLAPLLQSLASQPPGSYQEALDQSNDHLRDVEKKGSASDDDLDETQAQAEGANPASTDGGDPGAKTRVGKKWRENVAFKENCAVGNKIKNEFGEEECKKSLNSISDSHSNHQLALNNGVNVVENLAQENVEQLKKIETPEQKDIMQASSDLARETQKENDKVKKINLINAALLMAKSSFHEKNAKQIEENTQGESVNKGDNASDVENTGKNTQFDGENDISKRIIASENQGKGFDLNAQYDNGEQNGGKNCSQLQNESEKQSCRINNKMLYESKMGGINKDVKEIGSTASQEQRKIAQKTKIAAQVNLLRARQHKMDGDVNQNLDIDFNKNLDSLKSEDNTEE